jgi:hypothetical protein
MGQERLSVLHVIDATCIGNMKHKSDVEIPVEAYQQVVNIGPASANVCGSIGDPV